MKCPLKGEMITNIIHFIIFFAFFFAFQLLMVAILDKIMEVYVVIVNIITYKLSNFRGNNEKN